MNFMVWYGIFLPFIHSLDADITLFCVDANPWKNLCEFSLQEEEHSF